LSHYPLQIVSCFCFFVPFSSSPVSLGKNQALKQEKPKWKSDVPITEGQLRSKRDEFWETAPAFEGRKEIWDALKAAACALENNDYELAQAIVDGAIISLPNGILRTKFSIPLFALLNIKSAPSKQEKN